MTPNPHPNTPVGRFHEHLDRCGRCANNPMLPCAIGAQLLVEAATSVADKLEGIDPRAAAPEVPRG